MFEDSFAAMLRQYPDSTADKRKFAGLVRDMFPGQQMQINLILSLYDIGLAKEIETAKTINNAFAFRFVKRLMDEYGVSRANADWAVSVWCVCYGQQVLHKPCDIKLSSGKTGGPAIAEEKNGPTHYGDLFTYERSSAGNGLAVAGFTGSNNRTIIFQNNHRNAPVIEIKSGAFAETAIEEVIMTEGFLSIGSKAFYGCTNLKQIILPSTLRELGDYVLAGCAALRSVALPNTLEQIGAYAFAGSGLKTARIPVSVHWIGEGAFSDCAFLDDISVDENINAIPARMFSGCVRLQKVRLHEKLTSIEDYAFANCAELMTISIPDSVTYIGPHTFENVHEKFILQCSFGSYAESYARANKLKYQLI